MYLVPHILCGVHDVSEERVDRCVGHQDINPPALIQSLLQTHDETIIVLRSQILCAIHAIGVAKLKIVTI